MADLVLGPSGGNGGHEFDGYAIPAGAKVHEIRVNAGLYVDGLQLVYVDAGGATVELPHLGGKGGLHHTIALEADEYLTGISGNSGRYVDSIRFHTNKRTTDKIGGPGGEHEFHFEAAANGEVAAFFGRADWFIDKLGVIIRDRAAGTAGGAGAASDVFGAAAPVPAAKSTRSSRTAKATAAAAPAAPSEAASAKPPAKGRKKTAPVTDLVGIPDSGPVAPPAPDLVSMPDSGPVAPPAPDLVGIPGAGPVTATTPELVGVPDSTPITVDSASSITGTRTTTVDTATGAVADDLVKIEGIGPKISQLLNDAGITTFAALAATPVERLREILAAGGSRYRLTDPATWPQQAAHAARGDWDAFRALVTELKAGRRV